MRAHLGAFLGVDGEFPLEQYEHLVTGFAEIAQGLLRGNRLVLAGYQNDHSLLRRQTLEERNSLDCSYERSHVPWGYLDPVRTDSSCKSCTYQNSLPLNTQVKL